MHEGTIGRIKVRAVASTPLTPTATLIVLPRNSHTIVFVTEVAGCSIAYVSVDCGYAPQNVSTHLGDAAARSYKAVF